MAVMAATESPTAETNLAAARSVGTSRLRREGRFRLTVRFLPGLRPMARYFFRFALGPLVYLTLLASPVLILTPLAASPSTI